uniref:DUF1223 domain-containing protein n=1 Tax=Roseihalotalea indica TaxID=2867963 RepID=A0AA49JFB5_9BACT|nr:DUF1223 domain-containing protein [Tunicatimonas sp. TK19036]
MKYFFAFLMILGIVSGFTWLSSSGIFQPSIPVENSAEKGIAVVELFTSEGCSSCPSADRLLQTIVEESEEKGLPVYALSFHVDYWNRLGWKDPFSNPAFSERQRQYVRIWHNAQVYTPQMVVNGAKGFVGSNRSQAQDAIKQAMHIETQANVSLQLSMMADSLEIAYEVSGSGKNRLLQIAVTEDSLATSVSRGENAGRTLQHTGVVRCFRTQPLQDSTNGRLQLAIAPDIIPENAQIIVYVQDASTLQIIGAQAHGLPVNVD